MLIALFRKRQDPFLDAVRNAEARENAIFFRGLAESKAQRAKFKAQRAEMRSRKNDLSSEVNWDGSGVCGNLVCGFSRRGGALQLELLGAVVEHLRAVRDADDGLVGEGGADVAEYGCLGVGVEG